MDVGKMLEPVEESEAPDPQSAPRTPPKSPEKFQDEFEEESDEEADEDEEEEESGPSKRARNIFALVASGLSLVIGTGTKI